MYIVRSYSLTNILHSSFESQPEFDRDDTSQVCKLKLLTDTVEEMGTYSALESIGVKID